MVICPDCGKEVPEDKFCHNCGAYIHNIKEIPIIEDTETLEVPETNEETSLPVTAESKKINFCYNCGAKLSGDFKFCPECGQDLNANVFKSNRTVTSSEGKNVLLAVILSIILPGLGQIYLGLDNKGAIFLIAYVISAILILILIGFLLCAVIWIWALIDTFISANSINKMKKL